MNVDYLGKTETAELWDSLSKGTIYEGAKTKHEADRSAAIGGAVRTGLSAAGNILSSFFQYKTAELQDQTPPGQTAYEPPPPPPQPQADNTKTLLIVGGTALAGIVAFAALR